MPKNRKLQNIIGTEHITDAAETAIASQASGGSPGGSDTFMQYNNGGSFGATPLAYDDTADAEQLKIDIASSKAPLVIVQTGAGNAFEVHDATDPDNNRFEIDQYGRVAVQGQAGTNSAALYAGGSISSASTIRAAAGSNSAPAFGFDGDTNTGMYHGGTDALNFTTGGTDRMTISSAGVVNITGSLTVGGAAVGGGAIASIQDLKPQIDSDRLESVSGAGNYQKTLGGAPFFLNLVSWSTIQFNSTDFRDGSDNTFVVMWPYLGSGETMVKSRAYRVSVGNQDNDTEMNFVWYASDAKGLPTGAPVNSGICALTNSASAGAAVLEATWTNGPTLTAGELYWFGLFVDTTSSDGAHTTDMGNIRATPSFEQEALGFSSASLLLNSGNFGRVTGLKCSTSCGTTNGSRTAPTIGAGTISLATSAGYNIPRVSFEVTYS